MVNLVSTCIEMVLAIVTFFYLVICKPLRKSIIIISVSKVTDSIIINKSCKSTPLITKNKTLRYFTYFMLVSAEYFTLRTIIVFDFSSLQYHWKLWGFMERTQSLQDVVSINNNTSNYWLTWKASNVLIN